MILGQSTERRKFGVLFLCAKEGLTIQIFAAQRWKLCILLSTRIRADYSCCPLQRRNTNILEPPHESLIYLNAKTFNVVSSMSCRRQKSTLLMQCLMLIRWHKTMHDAPSP